MPAGATRHAAVSFTLAWSLFCLSYGAGFGLLVLSAFAAHGGLPWSHLSQTGAIGALIGGVVGLLRLLWVERRPVPSARRWIARLVWILWSGVGVLVSVCIDLERLLRRHDSTATLFLLPILMLGASIAGFLVLRHALRSAWAPRG